MRVKNAGRSAPHPNRPEARSNSSRRGRRKGAASPLGQDLAKQKLDLVIRPVGRLDAVGDQFLQPPEMPVVDVQVLEMPDRRVEVLGH